MRKLCTTAVAMRKLDQPAVSAFESWPRARHFHGRRVNFAQSNAYNQALQWLYFSKDIDLLPFQSRQLSIEKIRFLKGIRMWDGRCRPPDHNILKRLRLKVLQDLRGQCVPQLQTKEVRCTAHAVPFTISAFRNQNHSRYKLQTCTTLAARFSPPDALRASLPKTAAARENTSHSVSGDCLFGRWRPSWGPSNVELLCLLCILSVLP